MRYWISPSKKRRALQLTRGYVYFRPRLESLEQRLPPGDGLLGVLLASSLSSSMISLETNGVELAPLFLTIDDSAESDIEWRMSSIQRVRSSTSDREERESVPIIDRAASADVGVSSATRTASIRMGSRLERSHAFTASEVWITAPDAAATKPSRPAAVQAGTFAPTLAVAGLMSSTVSNQGQKSQAVENYGNLPISFEQNVGQTDERVDFLARTGSATVFLTPTAAVFAMQKSEVGGQKIEVGNQTPEFETQHSAFYPVADAPGSPDQFTQHSALSTQHSSIHMQIVGANPDARAVGISPLSGLVNYFIGNDPSQWHANIPTFGSVNYQDVYPGIDLAYYGDHGHLEYDFIVSPGANPDAIQLNFAGADSIALDAEGNLTIQVGASSLRQNAPYIYQELNGTRQQIPGAFSLSTQHSALSTVFFDVGAYDPSRPLVIDPLVLGYSTYLGGSNVENEPPDGGGAVAVDGAGAAYLTGQTQSTDFPATPGAFDARYNGNFGSNFGDVFVTKLSADGSALAYSTYLGGVQGEIGYGVAVDGAGNAYVTGFTHSPNFPTTPGAFDPTWNGGRDVFAVKLNAAGSAFVYSTLVGAFSDDVGKAIALDGAGNAYITGYTRADNFPTTPRAFQKIHKGDFDVIVTKVSADGSSLEYSTFLGGSKPCCQGGEIGYGIAVDVMGAAYVTGYTTSPDFPTTSGAFDPSYNSVKEHPADVFIVKLNPAGSALAYGTFLGGESGDRGYGIAIDVAGYAYVTGDNLAMNTPFVV